MLQFLAESFRLDALLVYARVSVPLLYFFAFDIQVKMLLYIGLDLKLVFQLGDYGYLVNLL